MDLLVERRRTVEQAAREASEAAAAKIQQELGEAMANRDETEHAILREKRDCQSVRADLHHRRHRKQTSPPFVPRSSNAGNQYWIC